MASLNKIKPIYTHEGARAANISPIQQLERSVMSCLLWESEFYEDGKTISDRICDLVAKIPAEDVARIAIQAKQDMRLRHVPLLLAREMARTKEGRKHLKTVIPAVIVRPDDITEFLAIYWKDNAQEPIAKQIKKHLGDAFRSFDEYQLQKYNGGQKAVKLRDAIRILRPKPANDDQAALWGRLVKNELATPDTWEVALSAGKDKRETFERLIAEGKLGGFALLRNMRNMIGAGVSDSVIKGAIKNLKAGRLLPINFIAAARYAPQFESALEAKFYDCFPKTKSDGKTIILVDVSGSMDEALSRKSDMRRIDVACSLAMIARETFNDVNIFTFSNQLAVIPDRRGFALRDALINSQPHGGTELGGAVRHVMGIPHQRLIVITDEQSQSAVPQVKGYMINVASNQNGVGYGQWMHIDGWSDKVIDYIIRSENAA